MIVKIRQKHKNGCVVASLAMLLNIKYDDALRKLHPKRKPRQRVTGTAELIAKAFNRMKIPVAFHNNLIHLAFDTGKCINIRDINNPAIICIWLQDVAGANHAVVWDPEQQKIIDPGRNRNLQVNYYQRRLIFAFELI
jgi:hypothetical protein